MASYVVDVHASEAKLILFRDGDRFSNASTVSAYTLWQMLLRVVADGSPRSSCNALYDHCSLRFDIAFHKLRA